MKLIKIAIFSIALCAATQAIAESTSTEEVESTQMKEQDSDTNKENK